MKIEKVEFTQDMKKDYKILVPNMLPIHFKLLISILGNYGYNMELLETSGPSIAQTGLKHVHNDTCYPAILVIGQLIDAIENGGYDKNKIALMISQTGGGCRASNYIHLLRKALIKAGYGYIPVISLNFSGTEKSSGFDLSLKVIQQLAYGVLLGDLVMSLYNQSIPYEVYKGSCDKQVEAIVTKVSNHFRGRTIIRYKEIRMLAQDIVKRFNDVEREGTQKKRVGIVGEIYIKFSPLGNNDLEKFLLSEDAEPVIPGLMDFCMYVVYNGIVDYKFYGRKALGALNSRIMYEYMLKKQKDIRNVIKENSNFVTPHDFEEGRKMVSKVISLGVKMGEGWLLPAEIIAMVAHGVNNVICTQPFGCLPNHIAGKGMIRKIREIYPKANIVPVDYDPSASRVNQENRIKLMLSDAD
ncbi:2-hydroxyacyl-CoA dehydratase [Proteocatella sphenisci]|uniref:2-hydroxyacyl-CoA dehydratase n=1 Tax=Proteocatella sphenisci TaxID=181070 RepID=UPI0004AF167E|nr:2-hydroxyacyl-CoA dehydratase [Proteocatella sphenisci]